MGYSGLPDDLPQWLTVDEDQDQIDDEGASSCHVLRLNGLNVAVKDVGPALG